MWYQAGGDTSPRENCVSGMYQRVVTSHHRVPLSITDKRGITPCCHGVDAYTRHFSILVWE